MHELVYFFCHDTSYMRVDVRQFTVTITEIIIYFKKTEVEERFLFVAIDALNYVSVTVGHEIMI